MMGSPGPSGMYNERDDGRTHGKLSSKAVYPHHTDLARCCTRFQQALMTDKHRDNRPENVS